MKCKSVTKAGSPCGGNAVADSSFCYSHDPALREQRREAQSRGGRGRKPAPAVATPPPRKYKLADRHDVEELANYALDEILSRRRPPEFAYAVVALAQLGLRFHAAALEERVAHLERQQQAEKYQPVVPQTPASSRFQEDEPEVQIGDEIKQQEPRTDGE